MSEKLCIFCEHGKFDLTGMYGPYPDPATFECEKGNGLSSGRSTVFMNAFFDEADFRQLILTAKDCPDYKQVKS